METIPASEEQEMLEIKTGNIIPVDLNSFLCKNARILSILFNKVENEENASKYDNISRNLKVWRSLVSVSEWGNRFSSNVPEKGLDDFVKNMLNFWSYCSLFVLGRPIDTLESYDTGSEMGCSLSVRVQIGNVNP